MNCASAVRRYGVTATNCEASIRHCERHWESRQHTLPALRGGIGQMRVESDALRDNRVAMREGICEARDNRRVMRARVRELQGSPPAMRDRIG